MRDGQELWDKQALRELVTLYCRAMDRHDFMLLESLYWPEAIDDHGVFKGTVAEFAAWAGETLGVFELTRHDLTNMLFAIDGDRAEGEVHVTAYHRVRPSRSPDKPQRELIVGGRYLDRYERRDEVWRFAHRVTVTDWIEERTVDRALLARNFTGAPMGRPGEDDPSYARLTMFGRTAS